ncbi:MAG: GNAT family N-acetyltransferase [Proteobacteria bacterium]|nr:GNAT family N-acetyltransferase [Pseudomonadota bacterium]
MEHFQLDAAAFGDGRVGRDARPEGLARFGAGSPLGGAWDRLMDHATLPTQAHGFASALANTMLSDAELKVFMARRAGGIAAIMPLCRDAGWRAPWRMVGAAEVFEPLDAVCLDDSAAHQLAEAVVADGRPLRFDRVPANSRFIPALQEAMRGRGLVSIRPGLGCPTIPLDASWVEPESRFNSGRRSDFRRAQRRAAEHGAVFYEIISPDPGEFDLLFDEAKAVELASWKKDAGTAIAVDPAKEAFFRAFLRDAAARGLLRVAFMRIDRRAVAMQLAIEWNGRFWLFKIGYDEAFRKASPGTLLMLHTLGYAARAGLSAYELLGNVEPWIAEFWTEQAHPCLRVRTYPANLRGLATLTADATAKLRGRLGGGS